MDNGLIKIWMLSQFYADEVHPVDDPTKERFTRPVCADYGENHWSHYLVHPCPPDAWGLVLNLSSSHQIEAAKKDPRVIVCGKNYAKPPAKLLEVYASLLDPQETYQFMGQVLDKLAETEPIFHRE